MRNRAVISFFAQPAKILINCLNLRGRNHAEIPASSLDCLLPIFFFTVFQTNVQFLVRPRSNLDDNPLLQLPPPVVKMPLPPSRIRPSPPQPRFLFAKPLELKSPWKKYGTNPDAGTIPGRSRHGGFPEEASQTRLSRGGCSDPGCGPWQVGRSNTFMRRVSRLINKGTTIEPSLT